MAEAQPGKGISPLERTVSRLAGRERKPLRIDIRMAFGGHSSREAADAMNLAEEIQKADLILMEGIGSARDQQKIFDDLSSGKLAFKDFSAPNPFQERMVELIHGTKKPIYFWDISTQDPSFEKSIKTMNTLTSFGDAMTLKKPDLEVAVGGLKILLEQMADAQKERDTTTDSLLEKKINRALSEVPILKTKSPLRVLTIYGSSHLPLYHSIKKRHPETKRTLPTNPYTFSHMMEYMRANMLGAELTDAERMTLVRKTLLETIVITYHKSLGLDVTFAKDTLELRNIVDAVYPAFETVYDLHVIKGEPGNGL